MQNVLRMIGFGENLGSGFQNILKAWSDTGWYDSQLNNRLDIDEVELVLPLLPMHGVADRLNDNQTTQTSAQPPVDKVLQIIKDNPYIATVVQMGKRKMQALEFQALAFCWVPGAVFEM